MNNGALIPFSVWLIITHPIYFSGNKNEAGESLIIELYPQLKMLEKVKNIPRGPWEE